MSVTTKQKTLRVLIVDDDADHATTLSLLLENSGYDSHVCEDARICLTTVQRLRPDVVLMDIGMPRMTGYEIAEAIKRDDDLQHIRLFALTGHGLPLDRLQTKISGFDQHLLKPVAFDDLETILKTVKTALESVHGSETKLNEEGV
jgi:CheY-like chemotaxis protein